jgi:hypothetical protein
VYRQTHKGGVMCTDRLTGEGYCVDRLTEQLEHQTQGRGSVSRQTQSNMNTSIHVAQSFGFYVVLC